MSLSFACRVWYLWMNTRNALNSRLWRWIIPNAPLDLRVLGSITVYHPDQLRVGRGVVMNQGVTINPRAPVTIGDRVHLSPYVIINAGELETDTSMRNHRARPVVIGNDVWIASGAMVNPGVTIHDGVIVGAGAVVTRDLPAYTLCLGVPARPVRELPRPS